MATYVLVHGAWHGGWCWQLVAPILRAATHEVYTPTLTGMGERSHLFACGVDFNMHVRDITNLLFFEDLNNIVLVGHGAASVIVNRVALEMGERIGQLVYFDAYMPTDSQFPFDVFPADQDSIERSMVTTAQAVRLPPAVATLGITEQQMAEWVEKRLTPQPLSVYQLSSEGDLHSAPLAATDVPRTYIHCTEGPMSIVTAPFAARARADGWQMRELAAGHDAMLTAPQEVAELLMKLVKTQAS